MPKAHGDREPHEPRDRLKQSGVAPRVAAKQGKPRGGSECARTSLCTQDGLTLRGWHYVPDGGTGKAPAIVMAHGFSAVKEMYLDRFAEVFAAAGLGALVFDNRNFGASDGEPRQEIDPVAASARLSRRDHVCRNPGRDRPGADRHLGIKLQRRPCPGRGGDRPAGQMRRWPGAVDQRPPQRPATDPLRLYRRAAGGDWTPTGAPATLEGSPG